MRDGARWWLEWADDAAPAALKHPLTAGRSSLSCCGLIHWPGSYLAWAELHKGQSLLQSSAKFVGPAAGGSLMPVYMSRDQWYRWLDN